MKPRRWISVGAVAVATAAALNAVPATASRPYDPTAQTLGALGQRHGLHIGTAVNATALNDASDPQYRRLAATEFSSVTAENAMKWESLEPTRGTYDWAAADQLIEFAKRNRQSVRGHVLVWHNQVPAWLTSGVADGSISKQELRDLLRKHITTVVSRYKGKIWQWDVVNEAVSDPWDTPSTLHYKGFWAQNLGPDYIADAFRWARAADPKALLFYNDYNIEAFGSGNPADDKTQFVYDMAKGLRAKGVPIDGVGAQGHLGTQYGNFDTLQVTAALKRFAGLGLATAFTEVDVRSEMTEAVRAGNSAEINPRLQASAANFSVLMKACLAVRTCLSYTVWGFSDKYSWVPEWFSDPPEGMATIYDENYQPKRAYQEIKSDLIFAGPPYVLPRIAPKPRR
ncbi:endo-1,4-beta-xylanase [Micromonospora profundi]|uniref:Beta-xylanase n=1 Tax=Micromonospora profundi TaxID=1420889 RepID=A0AAJ6L2X2_9ACTN|nr:MULTISPECIES: endo-1,4-beta-xylanase [Micromonospora]KOX02738.1 1,4-beta-xylanase [Micromonospora sp. NRRL B-16802]NJC12095.1 endo-1,4-beta-xylanase [Micromonospora profundi]WLS43966.1 endo-1,4-beta-xylanase [Micromonospora profundi]